MLVGLATLLFNRELSENLNLENIVQHFAEICRTILQKLSDDLQDS